MTLRRKVVVLVDSKFVCEAPELFGDNAGPMGHGVEKHYSCFPSDDADVAFGKAVLPVRANASEGLTLLAVEDLGLEITRLIDAIVALIVTYVDVV